MITPESGSISEVEKFAASHGISVEDDIAAIVAIDDGLEPEEIDAALLLDDFGDPEQEIRSLDNARYAFSQLNYWIDNELVANRMIATIQPGNRTELAYWSPAAPEKNLTVHRGLGLLALTRGSESEGVLDIIPLAATDLMGVGERNNATVPPDTFYALEVDSEMRSPMVVSGFYIPAVGPWEGLETEVYPGDHRIENSSGEITKVPYEFWNRYIDD